MAWHSRYWSCSNFADWLRGTPKLVAGTSKQWREWNKAAKSAHPFRYWLTEEFLDKAQDVVFYIPNKINDVRYYFVNRYITRSHCLNSDPRDIKRGQYYGLSYLMLPCLFNELVDLVEVEKAWMHVAWDEEARKKYKVPVWREYWWLRWGQEWRSKEAGLAHLDWEISLAWTENEVGANSPELGKPTPQANYAKEIKELYLWYTEVYRNRPDPMDVSGWSAYCDRTRGEDGDVLAIFDEDRTPEDEAESRSILDVCHKIEADYEAEDEAMLIRLIKIRHTLST